MGFNSAFEGLSILFLADSHCVQASSALRYRLPLVIGPTANLRDVISKFYIALLSTTFNKLLLVVASNGRFCELISEMFLQSTDCKCS